MAGLRLYDAHNHLQDPKLSPFLAEIAEAQKVLPVEKMVVNGTREEDWKAVVSLAASNRRIIPALGLHPWYIRERKPHWLEKLSEWVETNYNHCAIGEIGLDRWIEGHDFDDQKAVFIAQLRLAASKNLPVTIHCLKAWGGLLEILQSEPRPECGTLLHSYGGPLEMVHPLASLGAYFSISGYFAHERKSRQREVFQQIPLDRLLIETDAPDMLGPPPLVLHPLRDTEGKEINHPANLLAVYEFTAELRSISVEELASQVESNFQTLFGPVLN